MLMTIVTLCGIYLAGAALLRLPKLLHDVLAWLIAAALFWRDERRAAALWAAATAQAGWTSDRRAQRALDRATHSALALTEFVTRTPTQSDRATKLVRSLCRR